MLDESGQVKPSEKGKVEGPLLLLLSGQVKETSVAQDKDGNNREEYSENAERKRAKINKGRGMSRITRLIRYTVR